MTLAAAVPSEPSAQPAAGVAAGSSFYAGMRVLPKPERDAMYAVYGFCRTVDDIADDQSRPIPLQQAELQAWRSDVEALYAGGPPGRAAALAEPVARYGLAKDDLLALIDGMEMDLAGIVAPDLATLHLYCDRVAVAVGRLSVRIFGMPEREGADLAHELGRALQLTNILRDVDEDAAMGRLYLPEEYLAQAGIATRSPAAVIARPEVQEVCLRLAEAAEAHFQAARRILAANPPGRLLAPKLMAAVYHELFKRLRTRGWAQPRTRVRLSKPMLLWLVLRRGLLG
jgi:phytoene synthase